MKVYKLKGIDYYTVAFSKEDAIVIFYLNKIGVTVENIEETNLTPDRNKIGKFFKSLEDLNKE